MCAYIVTRVFAHDVSQACISTQLELMFHSVPVTRSG